MSMYLETYLRDGDKMISLASFSRSSKIYRAFERYVPAYAGVRAITDSILNLVRENLNREESDYKNNIAIAKAMIDKIFAANNSLEEKFQFVKEQNECIDEMNECLDEITFALNYITFIETIMCEVKYGSEDLSNKRIYMGIEVENIEAVED